MGILYNRLTQNIDRLAIYANVLTSVENGDYYLIGETYYIWNELSGWHPSANAGSGTDLGTLTSTSELPNFGSYYCYAGQNGDYYFIRDENKFYVWNSSTKSWDEEVNEPSTGNNWGKLPSLLDLPTSLEGGFFA